MINFKLLLQTFFNKRPVEFLARTHYSIKEGIISFVVPFLIVSILLAGEIFLARIIFGFVSGEELVSLLISVIILVIALIFSVLILLFAELIFYYLFGAVQFILAGFFRSDREKMNDFNGSFLVLFASVTLVSGIFMLIPVIGWILAILSYVYSIVLNFRFIRERFNLSDSQSAIVVFLPVNILLAIILIIVTIVSLVLITPRFF